MLGKLLELDAEVRQKRAGILGFLDAAQKDLDVAEIQDNKEGIATYTFLVLEYQQMLEEFDEHYGL